MQPMKHSISWLLLIATLTKTARDRAFFYLPSNDAQSRLIKALWKHGSKVRGFCQNTRNCVYLKWLFSHRKGFTHDCVSFKEKSTKRAIACRIKTSFFVKTSFFSALRFVQCSLREYGQTSHSQDGGKCYFWGVHTCPFRSHSFRKVKDGGDRPSPGYAVGV